MFPLGFRVQNPPVVGIYLRSEAEVLNYIFELNHVLYLLIVMPLSCNGYILV